MTKAEQILKKLNVEYSKTWSDNFETVIETSKAIIEVYHNHYLSEKYIVNEEDTPSIYLKEVLEFIHR